MELRAQLDTTAERLAAAEAQTRALRSRSADQEGAAAAASASDRTRTMPGPRTAAAGGTGELPAASRFGRAADGRAAAALRPPARRAHGPAHGHRAGPAQRAARRAHLRVDELAHRLALGAAERPRGRGSGLVDGPPTAARTDRPRVPRTTEAGMAARTRRADRRTTVEKESPSWILRAAAVLLLALLMLALVVIVMSVL